MLDGIEKAIAKVVGIARNTAKGYIKAAVHCGLLQGAGEEKLTDEALADVMLCLKDRDPRERGKSRELCEEQKEFIEKKLDTSDLHRTPLSSSRQTPTASGRHETPG